MPVRAVLEETDEQNPPLLGDIFRKERIRKKLCLTDIADNLKIRKVFLEAIENSHYEQLPGGVYTIGFVRSYAKFLQLDQDAIVEQLKEEGFCAPTPLHFIGDEQNFPTTRLVSSSMVLIGAVILAICAISAYLLIDNKPVQINWPSVKELSKPAPSL